MKVKRGELRILLDALEMQKELLEDALYPGLDGEIDPIAERELMYTDSLISKLELLKYGTAD